MSGLTKLSFAFVASALLHLGLMWVVEKGGPPPLPPLPSFIKGPSVSPPPWASLSPLQWVEVEATLLPPEEAGEANASSGARQAASSEKHSPEAKPRRGVPLPPVLPAPVLPAPVLPAKAPPPAADLESPLPGEEEALYGGDSEEAHGEGGVFPGEGKEVPGDGEESAGLISGRGVGGSLPPLQGGLAGGAEDDTALQQRLQANAHGCYPIRARRFRFQGTARLAFCVDAQGMATQTRLSQSSGHGSLDEAALECVLKKAQPLPPSSRGRCFAAPIHFGSP